MINNILDKNKKKLLSLKNKNYIKLIGKIIPNIEKGIIMKCDLDYIEIIQ